MDTQREDKVKQKYKPDQVVFKKQQKYAQSNVKKHPNKAAVTQHTE